MFRLRMFRLRMSFLDESIWAMGGALSVSLWRDTQSINIFHLHPPRITPYME